MTVYILLGNNLIFQENWNVLVFDTHLNYTQQDKKKLLVK